MGIDTNENMCSSWRKCAEKFVVARIFLCRENSFNAHGRSSVKMKRWQKGQAKGKNLIKWNKHPKHIKKLDKNTDKTERNRLESRWSRKVFLRVLICTTEIEQNKEGRYFSDQRSRICWVVRDILKHILMEILYRNDSAFDENGYRIGPKVSAQTSWLHIKGTYVLFKWSWIILIAHFLLGLGGGLNSCCCSFLDEQKAQNE